MSERFTLIQLDEMEIKQHIDLQLNDRCYYWRTYTTGKGYMYGETNPLITNFRAPITSTQRQKYKAKAIDQIAKEFIQVFPKNTIYSNYTFVPVPTSNGRSNPDYDDRLLKVLHRVKEIKQLDIDIREIVIQPQMVQQAHTRPAKERLSIEQLCSLYEVQTDLLQPEPKYIVIFDDVLTKGSHFKAVERTLRKHYPKIPILGLFIARSIYPE